jgi:plastocyanin
VLLALAVLTVIAILLSMSAPHAAPPPQSAPLGFPKYAPAPKAADAVVMQHGFDALVSFTGRGFEPSTITIKNGQTIRFTNNAAATLKLQSPTSLALPTQSLPPREYIEITFATVGTYRLQDAATRTYVMVTVK